MTEQEEFKVGDRIRRNKVYGTVVAKAGAAIKVKYDNGSSEVIPSAWVRRAPDEKTRNAEIASD